MRFWAFECMFVLNNNFLMGELFVCSTRKELLTAMAAFFRAPRAKILAAEVLGAWVVEDGAATTFYDAKPFVKVAIVKRELAFTPAAQLLLGNLDGAISREFLVKGKASASDAIESDEDDDDDQELKPFKFQLDAKGFLATLLPVDGEPLAADQRVTVVRPVDAPGYCQVEGEDDAPDEGRARHPNVEVIPGWSDAELDSEPRRFDPKSRFLRNLELPTL